MKKRITVIGIAFVVLAASCFGFFTFYKKYKHDVGMAYPVEQKIMEIYDRGHYPSDDQLEEMRQIEPYRKSRTVNLWWLTLFGALMFFSLIYVVFEFFTHGPKKKVIKPQPKPFKHIRDITPRGDESAPL